MWFPRTTPLGTGMKSESWNMPTFSAGICSMGVSGWIPTLMSGWNGEAVLLEMMSGRTGTSGWETQRASLPENLPTRRAVSMTGHMLQAELHISCPELHRSHYSTQGVVWYFKNKTKSYIFSVISFLCSLWENTYDLNFLYIDQLMRINFLVRCI